MKLRRTQQLNLERHFHLCKLKARLPTSEHVPVNDHLNGLHLKMIAIDYQGRICFSREHTLASPVRLLAWTRHARALANGLPPHRHEGAYEIHLLKRGRLDLVVETGVYNLRAGHLFITKPNEVHCGVGDTPPTK